MITFTNLNLKIKCSLIEKKILIHIINQIFKIHFRLQKKYRNKTTKVFKKMSLEIFKKIIINMRRDTIFLLLINLKNIHIIEITYIKMMNYKKNSIYNVNHFQKDKILIILINI